MFKARRKEEALDLEALEVALRASLHRAGAAALGVLLSECGSPARRVACECGQQARHHDRRSKRLLTALGPAEFVRGYYVCPSCGRGQSPRDRELDVEGTEFSPGVRRMMAAVGAEASFEQGREQAGQQKQIRCAKQLDLPEICTPAVAVLYIEMDGTGVPVTQKEREDRARKKRRPAGPHP